MELPPQTREDRKWFRKTRAWFEGTVDQPFIQRSKTHFILSLFALYAITFLYWYASSVKWHPRDRPSCPPPIMAPFQLPASHPFVPIHLSQQCHVYLSIPHCHISHISNVRIIGAPIPPRSPPPPPVWSPCLAFVGLFYLYLFTAMITTSGFILPTRLPCLQSTRMLLFHYPILLPVLPLLPFLLISLLSVFLSLSLARLLLLFPPPPSPWELLHNLMFLPLLIDLKLECLSNGILSYGYLSILWTLSLPLLLGMVPILGLYMFWGGYRDVLHYRSVWVREGATPPLSTSYPSTSHSYPVMVEVTTVKLIGTSLGQRKKNQSRIFKALRLGWILVALLMITTPIAAMPRRIRPPSEDPDEDPEAERAATQRANRQRADHNRPNRENMDQEELNRRRATDATRAPRRRADMSPTTLARVRERDRQARRNRRLRQLDDTHLSFIGVDTDKLRRIEVHKLGDRVQCPSGCGALLWEEEIKGPERNLKTMTPCCADGQVRVPKLPDPPEPLQSLLNGGSTAFKNHIREYNNALAMASQTGDITKFDQGPSMFKINGEMRHRVGSILPQDGQEQCFAQIYMLDEELAAQRRMGLFPEMSASTLRSLQNMMSQHNPFVQSFKSAISAIATAQAEQQVPDLEMRISTEGVPNIRQAEGRRYNAPTGLGRGELGAFIQTGAVTRKEREIVLRLRDCGQEGCRENGCNHLRYISDCHSSYHPLRFPLIFPTGGVGWHPAILKKPKGVALPAIDENQPMDGAIAEWFPGMVPLNEEQALGDDEDAEERSKTVTCRQWLAFHFQDRRAADEDRTEAPGNGIHLLKCGKLFQEFVVDGYCQTENHRTGWVRFNQNKIRADCYQNIVNAHNEGEPLRLIATNCTNYSICHPGAQRGNEIGTVKRVVLPSSFTGSPRHMRGLYQDAMTMVERLGKPDLFITFTCNPTWPEIKDNLLIGQTPNDRPDLIAKVFHLKLEALKHDIIHHQRLGRVNGNIYTIEFQKR